MGTWDRQALDLVNTSALGRVSLEQMIRTIIRYTAVMKGIGNMR